MWNNRETQQESLCSSADERLVIEHYFELRGFRYRYHRPLSGRVLYSPRNDPDPEMIPNPEMIPKPARNDPDPEMIPTFILVDPEMTPKEY